MDVLKGFEELAKEWEASADFIMAHNDFERATRDTVAGCSRKLRETLASARASMTQMKRDEFVAGCLETAGQWFRDRQELIDWASKKAARRNP